MAVFFAAVLLVFIGMTGLAVDYGFASLERRVLQNAVDAAATTGAANLAAGQSVGADVGTMVSRNGVGITATIDCQYIDNSNPSVVTGPCSGAASANTGGVQVTATNLRPTYFMRVLGVPHVTVSATSAARVFSISPQSAMKGSNSLFLVCGVDTKKPGSGNQKQSILKKVGGSYVAEIATDVVDGTQFVIHDPHVADCGMPSDSFKGLNATGAETGLFTLPRNLIAETGTRAGPTTDAVRGRLGCAAGLSSNNVDGCTMIIPVFDDTQRLNKDIAHAIMWVAFYVTQVDSNTHYGAIDLNYTLTLDQGMEASMVASWTKNTKQVLTTTRLWN
jgi:Flp pilus assembly protein TadG